MNTRQSSQMTTKPSIRELIEANSIPEPNSGCWLWLRGVNSMGYPTWNWPEGTTLVSRRALGLTDRRDEACHRCDNPLCVNYENHLFVGTRTDNMRDASAKGRLVGYGKRELCKNGHPLSGDNLYVDAKYSHRHCRECGRRRWRAYDARRKKHG
jgi:hypothetical protein